MKRGTARVGRRTKELVRRLRPREIAVVDHDDIDEVAARSLISARASAVLNAGESVTGRFPVRGALMLLRAGVAVVDGLGPGILDAVRDGDRIEVLGGRVVKAGVTVGRGERLTEEAVLSKLRATRENVGPELARFVDNTLQRAFTEKRLFVDRPKLPDLAVSLRGRHVLVVARGPRYVDDLRALRTYIRDVRPVLCAVDGGADALLEIGLRPDIIVGDMDSVSDGALRCGAQVVVHAYPDGRAPGSERVRCEGVPHVTFAAPGTSEDAALLLAHGGGASLIVGVGLHSTLVDFLEKGREGMASTLLVRMKVGDVLVDARGVSELYRWRLRARHVGLVIGAALAPAAALAAAAPSLQGLLRLALLKVRLLAAFLAGS